MTFSDILRILIEEQGITQKALAAKLNIAPSTLGGYVQGASEPDFYTLKRLAQYFGVSADYMLDCPTAGTHSHKEADLLRVFRAMPEYQQDIYLAQGKATVRVCRNDSSDKTPKL